MNISFPKWHEEARTMRAEGKSNQEIAKHFNVSTSRVSQVTNARWQDYMEKDAKRFARLATAPKALKEPKDTTMPDRLFEKFKSRNPEETRQGVIIRCHSCEATDLFMRPGAINPTHAGKTFRARGWRVGGGPKADTCPDCLKREMDAARKVHSAPVKTTVVAAPVKDILIDMGTAPQPDPVAAIKSDEPIKSEDTLTPMSKADKRLIIQKLESVYLDEVVGYREDWDDDKVAKDMGVPVQWVSEIRDDNFGPNTSAAKRQAALTADQVKTVEELAAAVKKARDEVEEALTISAEKQDVFDAAVAAFQRAYEGLHNTVTMKEAA